ncbi:MAG: type II toxin-antitoxin system HipA family toxin YjjJ, partial [Opitutaceae bacterium]
MTLLLQAWGPTHGPALAKALQVSPASFTRLVRLLGTSVERIGAARSSRYALRRTIRNFGSEWPIYRAGDNGRPRIWGQLRALHGGFRFVAHDLSPAWMGRDYPDGLFSGLPFFLQDVRPQGY